MKVSDILNVVDFAISGDSPTATEIGTARLYAVNADGSVDKVAEMEDIYDLLGNPLSALIAQQVGTIAVETCGWASPVGDDGEFDGVPPSRHPERRRVHLTVVASANETASALRFSDDWFEPIFDYGDAHGALADAVQSLFI